MGLLHKAAQDYEKHLEWYPKECLKSRMRQSRTYGSVRGGGSNASRLLDLLSYRAARSMMGNCSDTPLEKPSFLIVLIAS